MPFYEYQCNACAHRLEVLQKISDEPLLYCPECGEASLKKLISRSAFQLKGTGWYETDFKNSGKNKDQKKDDGKESKSTDPKNTERENKPPGKTADSTDKKDRPAKKSTSSTDSLKKSA